MRGFRIDVPLLFTWIGWLVVTGGLLFGVTWCLTFIPDRIAHGLIMAGGVLAVSPLSIWLAFKAGLPGKWE